MHNVYLTSSTDRDHKCTRTVLPTTRYHCSSTHFDPRYNDTHPGSHLRHDRHTLTLPIPHFAKFQHALAFEMREAVVANGASC